MSTRPGFTLGIDVVGTKFDIWIDDTKIMAGGRFLLRGDS